MQLNSFISQKFRFFSFLSMFLLVFVHGYNLNESYLQPFSTVNERLTFTTFTEFFLANGILRFRIPMLFAISGYLYALNDQKQYDERMQKRLRTLLVPYLIWSAVGLAITFFWQQYPLTAQAVKDAQIDQMGDNRPYIQMGWQSILARWLLAPISFQLWFLRVLLFYNALYPFFRWVVMKIPGIWFITAGLLWLASAGFYFAEGEGLLFFTLGIWISKRNKYLSEPPDWINVRLAWFIFITLAITKTILAFYLKPSGGTFMLLILLHKTVVFTGLLSLWYGADKLVGVCMDKKWFLWVSSFSFIIYALHVPLVNYCNRLASRSFGYLPCYRVLSYFILSMVVTYFCILVGWLMRTFIPKVYAICTGGRGIA